MIGPESVISILATTLLGTGALLSRLPIDVGQAFASPLCPVCRRHHRADEGRPF